MTGNEWTSLKEKKVFVRLKNGALYSGNVIDVFEELDVNKNKLIFIAINDKFDKRVIFLSSEILSIKEEKA